MNFTTKLCHKFFGHVSFFPKNYFTSLRSKGVLTFPQISLSCALCSLQLQLVDVPLCEDPDRIGTLTSTLCALCSLTLFLMEALMSPTHKHRHTKTPSRKDAIPASGSRNAETQGLLSFPSSGGAGVGGVLAPMFVRCALVVGLTELSEWVVKPTRHSLKHQLIEAAPLR
mgnify:CR=1 FL=1